MSSNKKPTPPERPKIRTVGDLSNAVKVVPYFLKGDSDWIKTCIENKREADIYASDDVFAVGVGPLTFRHFIEYENRFGISIVDAAARLVYIFVAAVQELSPDIAPENRITLEEYFDESGVRCTKTRWGDMRGSLQNNGTLMLIYLLSQFGRIKGVNADGTYVFDHITEDDLVDFIDPSAVFSTQDDYDQPLLFEILELTGVYQFTNKNDNKSEKGASNPKNLQ